ncbi:hypothetical protein BDA99DRAFT_509809 [Phascolomyces articulosus]|uniref:Uncharacterized protein n=1 Tax=Phascolomyces articulosus TaxID=60185 RepID=A0AAD5K0H0_9FUNG|nr:hypothetical protein BDA99DRAFT_509809 [Phascolomyces articulosus]
MPAISPTFLRYNYIRTTPSIATPGCSSNSSYSYYLSIRNNSPYNNHNHSRNSTINNDINPHRNSSTSPSPSPSPSSISTDYEQFEEETEATCGECGRTLGPGWQCESCRRNCPHCNRALTTDPDDYCERCFRKCDKHNIVYSIVDSETQEGPKCPECRKAQEENEHAPH